MIETILHLAAKNWPFAVVFFVVIYFLRNYFHNGLNKYPGPFAASLTDWWRCSDVVKRSPHLTHARLHRKHGDIVRLGPNMLSFANPKAVKDIYGLNKGYTKSAFYPVQQAIVRGERVPTLFSTRDEKYHAQLRRSVNSAFSMSSLVHYEPGVDVITELYLKRTEELYVRTNKPCDFLTWLQYYAFDVIGQVTYSKSHGFIERDEDVDGIVASLRAIFDYAGPVGQVPWLDHVFAKNPLIRLLGRLGLLQATTGVARFAIARMSERKSMMTAPADMEKQPVTQGQKDLLSKFLKAKEDRPEFFHDGRVLAMATSMAFAGSETTSISLAAIFYHVLKSPAIYAKLMEEIDSALEGGRITQRDGGVVTWADAQKLPYLDACVKEGFRMHPAAGLPLERIVPLQGATICGEHIPGGTIVGCNAWIIHHRQEIFGADADVYRPERWLECDKETRHQMDGTMFQFGAGVRTCIGKNISLLEIYKLIPSFLLRFKIDFVKPDAEWTLHNAWFVRPEDFDVKFEVREKR